MIKNIGIACDNYKLEGFKKALTENDFLDFSICKLTRDTSLISVKIDEVHLSELSKLVRTTELSFKNIK